MGIIRALWHMVTVILILLHTKCSMYSPPSVYPLLSPGRRTFRTVVCPVWCPSWPLSPGQPSCWIRSPVTSCWSTHWSMNLNVTCSRSTDTTSDRTGGEQTVHSIVPTLTAPSMVNYISSSYRDPDITFFDQMDQPIVMYRWISVLELLLCM